MQSSLKMVSYRLLTSLLSFTSISNYNLSPLNNFPNSSFVSISLILKPDSSLSHPPSLLRNCATSIMRLLKNHDKFFTKTHKKIIKKNIWYLVLIEVCSNSSKEKKSFLNGFESKIFKAKVFPDSFLLKFLIKLERTFPCVNGDVDFRMV